MRLVKQINDIDCGVAVAAMIASVKYDDASRIDRALFPDAKTGMSPENLILLIQHLTKKPLTISKRNYKKPLSQLVTREHDRAVLIRDKNQKYGHWVAIHKDRIYDPEYYISKSITDYERNNWDVIRVLSAA